MPDSETVHPIRVFLCHASGDKPAVRELYQRLQADGIDAWLDEEKLLPGQDWQHEIPKAVRQSDAVIVCLSTGSINKAGYIQKEIKFALDIADEQPEGTIFLIPLKLEECDVPDRLSRWQWVNLFNPNGYDRLLRALQIRATSLGLGASPTQPPAAPAPQFSASTAPAQSVSNVSGGVNLEGQQVSVGKDAVGRDKIVQADTYIEHATIIQSAPQVQDSPVAQQTQTDNRQFKEAIIEDWKPKATEQEEASQESKLVEPQKLEELAVETLPIETAGPVPTNIPKPSSKLQVLVGIGFILMVIILVAVASQNSVSSLAPNPTSTVTIAPIPTSIPSVTPIPTSQPTRNLATIADTTLYDNFNPTSGIDTSLWEITRNSCDTTQKSGEVLFSHTDLAKNAFCKLIVNQPPTVAIKNLEIMRADVKFDTGDGNSHGTFGVEFEVGNSPTIWTAHCGIGYSKEQKNGPNLVFGLSDPDIAWINIVDP